MKNKLKIIIRQSLTKIVEEAKEDNPMKNTPFESLAIKNALVSSSNNYKNSLKQEVSKMGINAQELRDLIDEVTTELHKKYLK